jgi:hypothetical protein
MGGGLMQLVAYGAQDVYLSGNPQITFFKVVYRRHTNFSVEPVQQTWNGAADFNRTVTCNINRNGDLITNMYVVVKLPARTANFGTHAWGFVNRLGHALISNVKIEIGGSKIDEQYGDWLNIWYELTHKAGQETGYAKMIGDVPALTTMTTDAVPAYQLYIPLQFWFNRNNGLALPLIALQYHDVRVTLTFRDFGDVINYAGTIAPTAKMAMADSYLLIDYVYLDSEERKRFAQASHEYLIEQVQFTGSETLGVSNNKLRLNFNHPSKYLIWAPHVSTFNTRNQWVAYATDGNWEAARNRFAKIIAIITAAVSDDTPVTITHTVGVGASDIFTPAAAITGGNSNLQRLIDKIGVRCVPLNTTAGTSPQLGASTITDVKVAAAAALDNVIVIKNSLTIEDISVSPATLKAWIATITGIAAARTDPTNALLDAWTQNVVNYHNYGMCLDGSVNPCVSAKLQLNGHDRFQERDGSYFNYVQPAQHFTNTPADGINVYSFALKAEDHQPTGSCNFSRIDNATLNVNTSASVPNSSIVNVYVQNYNVLRVMSGMAGTAYSN